MAPFAKTPGRTREEPMEICDDEDELTTKAQALRLQEEEEEDGNVPLVDLSDLPEDDDEADDDLIIMRMTNRDTEPPSSVTVPPGHVLMNSVTTRSNVKLRTGTNVELNDGDFLRVKHVIRNITSNEVVLQGILLCRTRCVNDQLPKKVNELCMILSTHVSTTDPAPEECLVIRPLDAVVVPREIVFTNQLFPAFSFRMDGRHYNKFAEIVETAVLVCRWRWTEVLDVRTKRVTEQSLTRLREGECDLRKGIPDVLLMQSLGVAVASKSDTSGFKKAAKAGPRSAGFVEQDNKKQTIDLTAENSDDEETRELSIIKTERTSNRFGAYGRCSSKTFTERFKPMNVKATFGVAKAYSKVSTEWSPMPSKASAPQANNKREGSAPQAPPGKQYTIGDICAGGGGTTRGAVTAGLKLAFALDHCAKACATIKRNFPGALILKASIYDLCTKDFKVPYVVVLHISFPCQPHSPAHTVPGKDDETNIATSYSAIPILQLLKPRIVTLEQTSGIVTHRGGYHFRALVHQLTSIGYSVRWRIVNMAEYGNVQPRKRLVIIAAMPGEILPPFPTPTHGIGRGLRRFTNIRDILRQVASMYNIEPHMRTSSPKHKDEYDPNVPLRQCITCKGGLGNLHPCGKRSFTLQELAGLQGFPIHHKFADCGVTEIKKQIGNAVPAVFATKLFETVVQSLRKSDEIAAAWKPEMLEID